MTTQKEESTLPEQAHDLTPSAKLVYLSLSYAENNRLTVQELQSFTELSPRVIRQATNKLIDLGLVKEGFVVCDARRKYFEVTSDE